MTAALRLVVRDVPAEAAPTPCAAEPPATEAGSGVRHLPGGAVPDLTDFDAVVEPPPIPTRARRPRPVERVDFDAVVATYGPRAPRGSTDGYFPTVPGIPTLVLRPVDDARPWLSPPRARLAVVLLGPLAGALLAILL